MSFLYESRGQRDMGKGFDLQKALDSLDPVEVMTMQQLLPSGHVLAIVKRLACPIDKTMRNQIQLS